MSQDEPSGVDPVHDRRVVAWLAQYDPRELPPELGGAFRLGPIQSSLGITQPVVWLANLSTNFKRAYETVDDPHDELAATHGGRLNRETGKRTFPRAFGHDEQARFDKLQDEYHNLRWRNLLNLGYDPATAATMVGAVRDAQQNIFSPPPLFALSPRMIVTDEGKRMSMRRVLIHYLDGKAEEAERALLEDLEREEQSGSSHAEGRKMTKNAKKRAKKKAKKHAQKQQEESTDSRQGPLNQEQLRYLREHQQHQRERGDAPGQKRAYTEEDRRIIEDALRRNGLTGEITETAALSPATAERIYKAAASGKDKEKGGDKDGNAETKGEKAKEDVAKPGYEAEVRDYRYAWCCDYCKTATFPTFAEAALHESKCPQNEKKEKDEDRKEDGSDQGGGSDAAAEGEGGGEKEASSNEEKEQEEEEEEDEEDDDDDSSEDDDSADEMDYGLIIKGAKGVGDDQQKALAADNAGLPDKNMLDAINFVDKGESDDELAESAIDEKKDDDGDGKEDIVSASAGTDESPTPPSESGNERASIELKPTSPSKKQSPSEGARSEEGEKATAATKIDAGRKDEKLSPAKIQTSTHTTESERSSISNASSGAVTKKKRHGKRGKKKNRAWRLENNDGVTDSTQSSALSSLTDQELAQVMKPLAIDYDDRVNDTALPQPNHAGASSILPPSPPMMPPPIPQTVPASTVAPPTSPEVAARLSFLTSENEILAARSNFLEQENRSLLLANEALRNELAAVKQKSVEAVQQVQLKAYVAETARDAAVERAAWLENTLANAAAEMATKEIVEREVQEVVMRTAAESALRQQQNHMVRPLPQANPLPQSLPPAYHLPQSLQPPQQQQQQLPSSPLAGISSSMMATPIGLNSGLLNSPAAPSSQYYSQNNYQSGTGMPDPLDSLDFMEPTEPPWLNPPVSSGKTDSVLSRLRRGDHA